MKTFDGVDELRAAAGSELGTSDWLLIDQDRIDAFAEATGDHQWIHVDVERAKGGPFGGTIAHGFLTLSLLPFLQHQVYEVTGVAMGINYGLDRVRFPAPVPAGSRVRAVCRLGSVTEVSGGVQCVFETTIEIEGGSKPGCVAESLARFLR